MEDENEPGEQADLLSEMSDIAAVRLLLADFHEDLPSRVARLRYLNELGANLGSADTMLFGGITSYYAWMEARSSFVHGNSVATILLCQSLIENLLGAVLYAAGFDDLPSRIQFTDTLDRCSEIGLVTDQELDELKRLASLRNPLTHFRDINDKHNLSRRSMTMDSHALEILNRDAWFAIGLAVRMLAKKPFRAE